jgi:hypothetical protein
MKHYFLIASCFIAATLSAGVPDSTAYRNEIGINATGFIQQFVAFGNVKTLDQQPYDIFYKYHFKKRNLAFRSGFGLEMKTSYTSEVNRYYQRYDLRLGVEKSANLVKKFYGYYGLDLIGSYSYAKVNNNIQLTGTSTTENGYGLGGVLGLEYRLNQRISFAVESSARYVYLISVDKFETEFPPLSSSIPTTNNSLELLKPIYIFVSIKF